MTVGTRNRAAGQGDDRRLVRRGGRRVEGDRQTTWSVADGSRGRRWRTVSTDADDRPLACALETSPEGTFTKLEAASSDRLLTLHLEDDGSLHGHVVTPSGVRHLALGRHIPACVLVEGDPFVAAALVRGLRGSMAPGDRREVVAVLIGRELDVRAGTLAATRRTTTSWALARRGDEGADTMTVTVGVDGLPVPGPDDAEWTLEL